MYSVLAGNYKNKFSNLKTNVLTIDWLSTESNKPNLLYPTIALYVGEKLLHPYVSHWVAIKITYQNVDFLFPNTIKQTAHNICKTHALHWRQCIVSLGDCLMQILFVSTNFCTFLCRYVLLILMLDFHSFWYDQTCRCLKIGEIKDNSIVQKVWKGLP